MALIGSSLFGNLKNEDGSDGKNLLQGRESADAFRRFIDESIRSVTGCSPNVHDVYDNFPKWIRERDSDSNFIEFLQYYYDWMYCKTQNGGQYYISSSDFLDLLNLEGVNVDILKSYASSFAADFPKDKIGNVGGNNGITSDNFIQFLKDVRLSFYQTKGSEKSYKYFFKKLYGITLEENSIDYPKKRILRLNGGKFSGWANTGTGPYETTSNLGGSYLNDGIIQDGYFYQDYSYIVKTGKVSDYDDILLEILHPAGLQPFFEQSFEDYEPIGGDGDYTEGIEDGCELTRIQNYLPYTIDATGDLAACVGCSGSLLNFNYFDDGLGISGPTYDEPTFNHPGWALAGETTESSGDIDKYAEEYAFKNLIIGDFLVLCSTDESPNDGITSCDNLSCIAAPAAP
jgi:hypothetical protein